jgi:hypothetical protein
MIKSELLKKIEAAKDDEDINDLLKGTDVESAFKVEVQPTLDVFKAKLDSDKDFKSFMDSEKDTHANKALETWKTNKLQTIINDEVLKATGKKKTPEQIKIEELEKQFKEAQDKAQNAENTAKVKDMIGEAFKESKINVDASMLFPFIGTGDMENVDTKISNLKTIFDENIQAGIKAAMADGNYTPPGENGAGELTVDDLTKMMM